MADIRPVRGRADLRRFIEYAYARNGADPHWIPPLRIAERDRLRPRTNPFFAHADVALLLAWRNGRVVGRIAAIDDRLHNDTHGDNLAAFGFFEAEDEESAHALLAEVEAWARQRGRAAVRGPLNPSLNESAGLLVDGFDRDPMLMMPHNPREYAGYLEAAGYGKAKDLFAWLYDMAHGAGPKIERMARRFADSQRVVVRRLELREFDREVDRLREIYCRAWERNWGFVAPTEAEFRRIAKELRPIFDPRCALIAEVDGRPIACAVAVPDINQALKGTGGRLFPLGLPRILMRKRIVDQARLLLVGIVSGFRRPGLFALLMCSLDRQLAGTEYRRLEFSWVLEDNRDVNRAAEELGSSRYKTYRIYQKTLA
jgi:hypothetical protein